MGGWGSGVMVFGMLCQEGGVNGCLGGIMDKSLIALEKVL